MRRTRFTRCYPTWSGFKVALPPEHRPKQVVQPQPPAGLQLEEQELWCPYCAQPTQFEQDHYLGVRRCVRCGISDRDFYVRASNHLD